MAGGSESKYKRLRDSYSFDESIGEDGPDTWTNPLTFALPNAPDFKIYAVNGVNIPTASTVVIHQNKPLDKKELGYLSGDCTVPRMSNDLITELWKSKSYNPYGVKIVPVSLEKLGHKQVILSDDYLKLVKGEVFKK